MKRFKRILLICEKQNAVKRANLSMLAGKAGGPFETIEATPEQEI